MSGNDAHQSPAAESVSILAANVRRLRAEASWSTRAFADQAGLSLSTLYGIEHGQQATVRLSTATAIAKAFGVHVSVLLSPGAKPRTPWSDEDPLELAASALTKLRKARGLSQDELASAAGVARDILAKIERQKRNPTLTVLDRLAAALGTTSAEILRGEPSPPASF